MKTSLKLASLTLVLMLSPRLAMVDAALAATASATAPAGERQDTNADLRISSEVCAQADGSIELDRVPVRAVSAPGSTAPVASDQLKLTKSRWGAPKRWKLVKRCTVEMVRRTRCSRDTHRSHPRGNGDGCERPTRSDQWLTATAR